ncbi:PREDICTED: probable ethanolamine kinase [Acropora digitifera]|uniref:probable ethanolamine kinase n=1 Tax=Acropora digitifera TaxID=70779 RepID=UPI00077AE04C|nr:PREDICTED: probable ethanolamine kinase [Acropora digitifera]
MEVRHFDNRLDPDNTVESIKPVLKQIRPQWDLEKVNFKEFNEGISNKLVGCILQGLEPEEMILFRLYGNKTELFIDRKKELETFQILHSKGYGPPVYGTLENGIAYGFLAGDVLNPVTIADPHISSLCARHMARIHAIKIDHENSRHKAEPMLFNGYLKYLNLLPDKFEDPAKNERYEKEAPSKSKLKEEIEILKGVLLKHKCPIVLCHNDLLCANIIYNRAKDTVLSIDYEYASMNFLPHDIGNHFCEYAGVDEVDYNLYPQREHQMKWIAIYLDESAKLRGENNPKISEEEVEKLYVQANHFALGAHFYWAMWALVQAHFSTIDFDFLG